MIDQAQIQVQTQLTVALLNPLVYGPTAGRVEMLETHISYVFLAGDYAYKVKKAVEMGFLDFRTLAARRHYCEEELRLNRRLAPTLYLEVVPITGSAGNPTLGGDGAVIEYAVKMHRFSQDALLNQLLARKQVGSGTIDELAQLLATFHASIAIASENDPFGSPSAIKQSTFGNFSQITPALADPHDRDDLDRLHAWTMKNFLSFQEVFMQRKKLGYVRECHGDLHSGNIALVNSKITIFDCLEFNENLRWIDIMNEVGFLVMDLQEKKHPTLSNRFLNAYLEITGDYEGLRVLRFYMVYRAIVRAKVAILRAQQSHLHPPQRFALQTDYRAYLALANSLAATPKPALIIMHGLSGSGKTTIAQSLLESIGAIRIRSDVERMRMQSSPCAISSIAIDGEDIYSAFEKDKTYRRLIDLARIIINAGFTAIVDATFLKRSHRIAFQELAEMMAIPFVILDVTADAALLKSRIQERLNRHTDASQADVSVLEHQLTTQEPIMPDEMPWVISCDSTTYGVEEETCLLSQLINRI